MKSKAIFAVVTILLAFPAGLRAQQAGFLAGIDSRHGQHTVVPTPPFHKFPGNGIGHHRGSVFPQRGSALPRRGMAVPRGSGVFVVGPYGVKNTPGHEPRTPSHPTLVPGVTVITPGTGRVFTGGRRETPFGIQPGVRIIQPEIGSAIAVGPRESHSENQNIPNILRGASRDEVIVRFGRPTVQILNRNSETMVFGGTTIIIQNGVVALVR